MIPRLTQVNIAVHDMDAMAAFYEQLGLPLAGHPDWAAHHRSAAGGDAPDIELGSIAFASQWNAGCRGRGIMLGFEVPTRDDVDRLYDELTTAGAESQQPPYDAFWGARFAVIADPDGNAIALTSPFDPAHKSAPPPIPRDRGRAAPVSSPAAPSGQ